MQSLTLEKGTLHYLSKTSELRLHLNSTKLEKLVGLLSFGKPFQIRAAR